MTSENSMPASDGERFTDELERSESECRRLKELIELAVDAIFTGDPQGNFTALNQSGITLTGYSREELLTMHMGQLFSEEEKVRAPLRYDLLRQGRVVLTERLLTRKDGTTVPIEMNSRMMPDGTLHAFIRDISQRRRMEQEVSDSRERQRALAEATFEAIIMTRDGICIGQNENVYRLFGYTEEELRGRMSIILIAPQEREHVRSRISSGYEDAYETVGRHKDGREFPIEIRGRMLNYQGDSVRMAVMRDISAQKQAEKDQEIIRKLESVGTLAGGIAHDFNNILTGLFGNISLAKLHLAANHPATPFIEQAENSLNRATHLTGKLLTFAKGGEPVLEAVGLEELIRETVTFDLSGSSVRLQLEAEEGLWWVEADRGQLQQVFSNLAINARQAMGNGGNLTISLSNCVVEDESGLADVAPGRYIRVIVKDDGAGISEKHLPRIFDPYFSTKETGRGLGLASVFSIVSRHRGKITVDSKLGCWTAFTILLPASSGTRHHLSEPGMDSLLSPQPGGGKVLVMDDDRDILQTVSRMLESMHCTVVAVVDGSAAVREFSRALAGNEKFDLVILDLTVPGTGGGKETVQEILALDAGAKVVVSSGYTEDTVMANYRDYGFCAVVPKPYVYGQLQRVVFSLLQ